MVNVRPGEVQRLVSSFDLHPPTRKAREILHSARRIWRGPQTELPSLAVPLMASFSGQRALPPGDDRRSSLLKRSFGCPIAGYSGHTRIFLDKATGAD